MKNLQKKSIITIIQTVVLLVTAYFTIVPFFRPTQMHLEIDLPRHVFYTVQSNMIIIAWCLYLILRRFFKRLPVVHQGAAQAMAVYITVTGLVYWAILVPMLDGASALFEFNNIWLHTVTPVFGIWSFMSHSKKAPVKMFHIILSMIYPTLYYLYTFRVHAIYGKFPYPFLDTNAMGGLAGVAAICILILGLFFLLGWVFQKAYDRRLSGSSRFQDS